MDRFDTLQLFVRIVEQGGAQLGEWRLGRVHAGIVNRQGIHLAPVQKRGVAS